MKRFRIHTTTAAVLALMTAGSFAAPKKKTVGDTAKGIIDALLGDDKQPAPAQGKAGAGLAGNVAQFSGKWNIEDGSGAITVKAAGTAAQVHWDFAKGGGDDGVGIERGGKFYIGYGGVAGPGILVFQMAVGKLTGVGAVSKGGVPAAFTETLTGPAGLNGQYMSSRGEKVGIAPAANDSYLVIWTKTKRAGFGKRSAMNSWSRSTTAMWRMRISSCIRPVRTSSTASFGRRSARKAATKISCVPRACHLRSRAGRGWIASGT